MAKFSKRMLRALVICGFAVSASAAHADGSVRALGMGRGASNAAEFARYQSVAAQYNSSGERLRIDMNCRSACTLFLGVRNVCVSPAATFSFHAGHDAGSGKGGGNYTQQMLGAYNSALRQYVTDNHFMDNATFHSISGREMISRFGYQACS